MLHTILIVLAVLIITNCTPTEQLTTEATNKELEQTELTLKDDTSCLSIQMTLEYWQEQLNIPYTLRPLNKEQRLRFLSGFNNHPPISDYNPKDVYLILLPDRTTVVVILHNGECITLIHDYPKKLVDKWGQS